MASHTHTGSPDSFSIIGRTPAIIKPKAKIPQLAASTEPLVIIGETGVGKTLFARNIHANSPGKPMQLASVNFSILNDRDQRVALLGGEPPDLTATHRGCLERPSTVILKHIDRATPFLQEQLALALETRRVTRLGSHTPQFASARVILTLREPIARLHRKGALIQPLYKKLSEYEHLTIPPLRARKADIPLLARNFFDSYRNGHLRESGEKSPHIIGFTMDGKMDAGFRRFLIARSWPQNILGLKAYLSSLVVESYRQIWNEQERIELKKMELLIEQGQEFSFFESMGLIQQYIFDRACRKYQGKDARAARMLGISARTVRRNPNITN